MANNPSTLPDYNGQINPPTAAYPYGSARDDVTPGDLTGTPRVAAELKDIQGFQQALLSRASVVPSGTADTAETSQYLESLRKLFSENVDDVATLRTMEGFIDGTIIYLKGHTTAGVGGGYLRVVGPVGSEVDNDGTLFIVDGKVIERVTDGYISPEMFGALDRSSFQKAVDAVPPGGKVRMTPGLTYTIDEVVRAAVSCTLEAYGATINYPNSLSEETFSEGLLVTASDFHIRGGKWRHISPLSTPRDEAQRFIHFKGPSAASPLNNVTVQHADIRDVLGAAVVCLHCTDFRYSNNIILNTGYAGILTLSAIGGLIVENIVKDVNTNGTVGENAYGIYITKNNSPEATFPRSQDIVCANNLVDNVPTWEGIDTHGGVNISFIGNVVTNCSTNIAVVSFNGGPTPATDNFGPLTCTVVGNVCRNQLSVVPRTDARRGIVIEGNSKGGTDGEACVCTGNTLVNVGGALAGDGIGAIEGQAIDSLVIADNTIFSAGSVGIITYSCENQKVADNVIKNIDPLIDAQFPQANLTYSGIPADGDTITLNGIVFTYRNAPSVVTDIQIGGDIPTTLTNTDAAVVAAKAVSSPPSDGRLQLIKTESNGVDAIIVSCVWPVRVFRNFLTLTASSAVITPSSNTLPEPTADTGAFIIIDSLSGGVTPTGVVSGNMIENTSSTAAVGVRTKLDMPDMHFRDNRFKGEGALYDLKGSATLTIGSVDSLFDVVKTVDLPSIPAGGSYSFNVPLPGGALTGVVLDYRFSRTLDGLVSSVQVSGAGYGIVRLDNPTSGSINIASMDLTYGYRYISGVGFGTKP